MPNQGHHRSDEEEERGSKRLIKKECSFIGCHSSKFKCLDTHFYNFPTSRKNVCDQWIENCKNESLRAIPLKSLTSRVVCENHFTKECFFSYSEKRKRLKLDAVPTLASIESKCDEVKESDQQKKNESTCDQNIKDKVKKKRQNVVVLFDNGIRNIVDVRDLKAVGKSRWSKKQIKVICSERVKMYYEKKLYLGTIVATDPKEVKQYEEACMKSFQSNSCLGDVTNEKEEFESVSCAEIVIEKDEEEFEMGEQVSGPTLEENLVLDLMATSIKEISEETAVIYEEFEEYEEKYDPGECGLNIVVSEVFSQSDISFSDNLSKSGDENLNSNPQFLSKDVNFSYYEQKFGLKPCSVALEKCKVPTNSKDKTNRSSNSPASETSDIGIVAKSRRKRTNAHFNDNEEVSLSKLIKSNFSLLLRKIHNEDIEKSVINQELVVEGGDNVPVIAFPYILNESTKERTLLESQVLHENLTVSNNSTILQENNNVLKQSANLVAIPPLSIPANNDGNVNTLVSKDENCLNQISKSCGKEFDISIDIQNHLWPKKSQDSTMGDHTKTEAININNDSPASSLTQNNPCSSLIARYINLTKAPGFGFRLASNFKDNINNGLQKKLLQFPTNGTLALDFKPLSFFDVQSASTFMQQFKNTFFLSNISQMNVIIHPPSNSRSLGLPTLIFNSTLDFSSNLVQKTKRANQNTLSLPQTRIVEITNKDTSNSSLDIISDLAISNSILNCFSNKCLKKNDGSKENTSSETETSLTTETIQNIKSIGPILPRSQFVNDVSRLQVNPPKVRVVDNKCAKSVTAENIFQKGTSAHKKGLSLPLRKSPVTLLPSQTSSLKRKLSDPLNRRPSLETNRKHLSLRSSAFTCGSQTTSLVTEPSLQPSRNSATNDEPHTTMLICEKVPSTTNIQSHNSTKNIEASSSCEAKLPLYLNIPVTTSTTKPCLSLKSSDRANSEVLTPPSLGTGSAPLHLLSSSISQTETTSSVETNSQPLRRSPIKARKRKVMPYLEWECSKAKVSKTNNPNHIQNPDLSTCELKEGKQLILMSNGGKLQTFKSPSSKQPNEAPLPNKDVFYNDSKLNIPKKAEYLVTKTYLRKHSTSDLPQTVHSVSFLVAPKIESPVNLSKSQNMLALEKTPISKKIQETDNKVATDKKVPQSLSPGKLEPSNHNLNSNRIQKLDSAVSNSLLGKRSSLKLKSASRNGPNNQEPKHRKSKVSEQTPTSAEEPTTSKEAGGSAAMQNRKSLVIKGQAQIILPPAKSTTLSELLDSAPPFIQEIFKCSNIRDGFINSDLIFVLGLLPDMEEMTASQKYSFQLKVIDLLTNVLDDPSLQIEMQR